MQGGGARRRVGLIALSFVAVAGCLFPSFEGFDGESASSRVKDAGSPRTGGDASEAPTGLPSGSTTVTAPTTTQPVVPRDGGPPNPGTPGKISCGSRSCNVGSEFCCAGALAPDCLPNGDICVVATVIRCDGNEDCAVGTVCCAVDLETVECRPTCATDVVCTSTGTCATGQCTKPFPLGYKGCQ